MSEEDLGQVDADEADPYTIAEALMDLEFPEHEDGGVGDSDQEGALEGKALN